MKRLLAIGAIAAAAAFAQPLTDTGTVTVTGNVPVAISMTDTSGGALSATLALGTLTVANTDTLKTANVGVRIRSNKAYKLSAAAAVMTFTGPGSDDGGSPITAADIGFGITATDKTGGNVATGHSDTIISKFDYTGAKAMSSLTVPNGTTPFVAGTNGTLADLSGSTDLVTGTRISAKGNIETNNNFVLLTLGVGVLPQYFTPNTGFTAVITLTAATT